MLSDFESKAGVVRDRAGTVVGTVDVVQRERFAERVSGDVVAFDVALVDEETCGAAVQHGSNLSSAELATDTEVISARRDFADAAC